MKFNLKKGSTIISTSIILVVSIIVLLCIGVFIINSITPFIWYEKLNNIALKYMFVIEKYGYLTDAEKNTLINDMKSEGFDISEVDLKYPSEQKAYGELLQFSVKYNLKINLPTFSNGIVGIQNKTIPLSINKSSYCKR